MDSLAYPSRGGVGRKSGGDPVRGQHHGMEPDLDGLDVDECAGDELSVSGRVSNAAPTIGARAGERIAELGAARVGRVGRGPVPRGAPVVR